MTNKDSLPASLGRLGRRGRIHAIDGSIRHFRVEDEVFEEQRIPEKDTRKVIVFQRLRFEESGHTDYRFTYYMIGVKPGAKGRWVFGQYSLLIPPTVLRRLLAKAKRRNWPGVG